MAPTPAPPPDRPHPPAAARPALGSAAWRAAVIGQARIFLGRQVRLAGRDRAALALTALQGVVVGVLTSYVAATPFAWSTNGSSPTFVFGCAAVWFGVIGSVRELVKERPIWRREYSAGGSLAAYLSAKVTGLAMLGLLQSLALTVVIAATLGLPDSGVGGAAGITTLITIWLGYLGGTAFGLLVSATSPTADRALSVVPYLLVGQLVLCGVLFHLGAMTFLSWLSPARWSVSAFGGLAGLDAAALHQSGGLYPDSAAGLYGTWLALIMLSAAALAGTCWSLVRQSSAWDIGTDAAPPLTATMVRRLRDGSRG